MRRARWWPKALLSQGVGLEHYSKFEIDLLVRIAVLVTQHKALGRWPAIEGAEWLEKL
jgi:hypothetical protein